MTKLIVKVKIMPLASGLVSMKSSSSACPENTFLEIVMDPENITVFELAGRITARFRNIYHR